MGIASGLVYPDGCLQQDKEDNRINVKNSFLLNVMVSTRMRQIDVSLDFTP